MIGFHSFEADIASEVLFPVDQRLSGWHVDDRIVELWNETPVPDTDDDLIAAVKAAGEMLFVGS